jgi:hypothetical protein
VVGAEARQQEEVPQLAAWEQVPQAAGEAAAGRMTLRPEARSLPRLQRQLLVSSGTTLPIACAAAKAAALSQTGTHNLEDSSLRS